MTAEDAKRQRLTQLMEERRVDLRMQWEDVADEIGISVAHLRRVRNGQASLTFKVTRGIDRSMRWTNGSTMRIMDGGEPEPLPDFPGTPATGSSQPPLSVVEDIQLGLDDDPDPREAVIETRDGPWGLKGLRDQVEVRMWASTDLYWQERAAMIRGRREAMAIRAARRGQPAAPPEPEVENGTEG